MRKLWLITVLIFYSVVSCTKTNVNNNSNTNSGSITCTGTKSFISDVSPILQNVCSVSGCHNAGSTNGPGPLTNYQQAFGARTNIRSAVASGLMPQNTTLSSDQKAAIICWIDSGAPNN